MPSQTSGDEQHFAAIAQCLAQTISDLEQRLDQTRRAPGGLGQAAMDRDLEVHRLTTRLRALRRFGPELCLGRMVYAGQAEPVYVGRFGLTDRDGRQLLVDWRSPAAEPFFGATHGNPMGLASRRRYRWSRGKLSDYWDEVFSADAVDASTHLDDQSAFIASLGSTRSARMRDVLATIQADQDAIIRAPSRGALVVDGGPGTGKTVVALHRAAYLLYTDPRLGHHRGDVLVVGPHQPYLSYVADVLPSLGEEGVQLCTLRDLLPEGATAPEEPDPQVARLKSSVRMVRAIEAAVRFYEEPPAGEWADAWADAFAAVEPGTPHNEALEQIAAELPAQLRPELFRAWPVLEAEDLLADLWSVPAYLRHCAPWLTPEEVRALQRDDPQAWTVADLPLLDAARRRLGDPTAGQRHRRREAMAARERQRIAEVVRDFSASDDEYRMGLVTMLRVEDFRDSVVDEGALPTADPDRLAGPFAHVVVDEAQELTDAEWQMLLARCPSRSFTVVGDRAQARHGFTETWEQRLTRVGFDRISVMSLTVNYRTPQEVMAEAEPVIRSVLPDANVPTSIRRGGTPVLHAAVAERDAILAGWLAAQDEGVACVVGDPSLPDTPRVRSLAPELVKGLEFDLVVLVDPQRFGTGIEGAVDRYVAMTRATQQLVVLTS